MATLIPKKITIEFEGVAEDLVISRSPSQPDEVPLNQIHVIFVDPKASIFYDRSLGGSPGTPPHTTQADDARQKLDDYRRGHDPGSTTNPTTQSPDPFCIKLSDCTWWCPDQT